MLNSAKICNVFEENKYFHLSTGYSTCYIISQVSHVPYSHTYDTLQQVLVSVRCTVWPLGLQPVHFRVFVVNEKKTDFR